MRRLVPILVLLRASMATGATCPEKAFACFRLAVHIVAEDGHPVVDDAWIAEQVAVANRHFAPAGMGFEVSEKAELPANAADIATRADRDHLGRHRLKDGSISVFVVRRLVDVDADPAAEIRGVHWHDRADRRRRFIILSHIAPPVVLAHELGHYFGLSHSKDAASIMNKTKRAAPPPEERTFTPGELEIIRRSQHP